MILVAAVLAAALAPTATLCIDANCRPASGERVAVAPAEVIRPFVWISPDLTQTVTGSVAAGASEIVVTDDTLAMHQVTVTPSDGSSKIETSFQLRCGESSWKWSLPRLPKGAMRLKHPAGGCSLSVSAQGYKTADAVLATSAVAMTLRRLPVISGSVLAAGMRTPIARAEIFLPEGKLLTTTDASGRFRVPIDGGWPLRLRVDAIGRASRIVDVPKVIADVELPIALSFGGSITATLAPPLGNESLRWEARRILQDVKDESVRAGEIDAGQSTLTIDGLDAGVYRLVLFGDEPLQRIAVPVQVRDAAMTETTVEITPARLELEVLRGGKPFGGAEIEFVFRDGPTFWRSKVKVNDEGRKDEEIWQHGEYLAAVSSWVDSRRLEASETISWKLDVPDRIIRGRITDAATHQPLADVPVSLELWADGNNALLGARSGADGVYEFKMVPVGSYSLIARVNGYEELHTPAMPLAKETVLEQRDLALQMASGPNVRVLNAAGVPMPGVILYVATNTGGVRTAGITNDDGRLSLPISADERGVVYAVPRSGSFGMTRFVPASESGSRDVVVSVADGTSTLEVQATSTDGEPIGGMSFLLRIDGLLVPTDVKEALSRYQGWPHATDAAGRLLLSHIPPGRYEIWPHASRADLLAITSAAPPPAPVNVTVTPGHHVAQMTFKEKS